MSETLYESIKKKIEKYKASLLEVQSLA